MPIDVACQCGARFRAKDQLAGKQVRCPRCNGPLWIPALPEARIAPLGPSPLIGATTPPILPSHAADALRNAIAASEPPPAPRTGKYGYELARGIPTWLLWMVAAYCVAAIPLSMLLTVGGCMAMERAEETTKWHVTTGQITKCTLTTSLRIRRGQVKHNLELSYVYTVDGKEFAGNRVSVAGDPHSPQVARKYPKGSQHAVYFNPKNPAEAVLEPGFGSGNVALFAIAAMFALSSIVGLPLVGTSLLSRYT